MDRLGLKQKFKLKNISFLMDKVDVRDVLRRLGVRIDHASGREIRAFCPDHHIFVGRESSHPNWTVNTRTGETFCFTEGRGSNLLFTVCRKLDCGAEDGLAFLMNEPSGVDLGGLRTDSFFSRASRITERDEDKPEVKGLEAIAKEMSSRYMSDGAYRFFIHPPGKTNPTNITPETVDYHWVFERTWGYYTGRVVIPFVMRGLVVGFCAVDMEGKDAWLRKRPSKTEDDYRKVLYPSGFVSGNFLFGFDDCGCGEDLVVLVEGAREKMKLWQEGFTALAILGSYVSDQQMVLLSELSPKRVALMFDGDDAGMAATERAAKKLEKNYPNGRLMKCFVPRGKDPKNLCREDFERILKL